MEDVITFDRLLANKTYQKPFTDSSLPLSSLTICSSSAGYLSHQEDLGLSIRQTAHQSLYILLIDK